MKKCNSKILITFLLVVFAFISCFIYAAQIKENYNNSVKAMSKREALDILTPVESETIQYDNTYLPEINESSMIILNDLGEKLQNVERVTGIYDRTLDRNVIRVVTDKSEVDVDENGTIVAYKNYEDYSIKDKDKRDYVEGQELEKIDYLIKEDTQLTQVYDIISIDNDLSSYKLVDCSNNIESVWVMTWCKVINEDLINPYDCINVVVDAKDGSIMLYGKNSMKPNAYEPEITAEEAVRLAKPVIDKIENVENIDVNLTYFRPNFFWEDAEYEPEDFVRLSWNVSVDDNYFIQIDAITGENIGGDVTQSICGRALSVVTSFVGYQQRATLASNALSVLEYNQYNYPAVSWAISQTDIDWVLSRPDLYALYLNCHGGVDSSGNMVLADTGNILTNTWQVWSTSDLGIWRFVYLDACETSVNSNFANAFHATYSGECFIGWNVSVYTTTAYDFDQRFFPRLGYMTVLNDVITSLWESRNAGFNVVGGNICDPGFMGDTNYYGWAW